MTRSALWRIVQIGTVVLLLGVAVRADDDPTQVRFNGLINDYTAASLGSWEVRGEWSLLLRGDSGTADFSAVFNMIRSDYWLLTTPGADPQNPTARTPHTHHISVAGGVVTSIPHGFRVTGAVVVTASGNPAPFGGSSTLQIDVTGGDSVTFSNVKLTFLGDAATHFGSQPLDGVVRIR